MRSPPQTASAASRVQLAGEHRQPTQQSLFGPGEQVEGPVDRGTQRLVPFHRAAPAAGQRREPPVQPPGQLGRGHRRQPRRGQLDRQRYPVQPPGHRGDRRRILRGNREAGLDRGRAVGEQPHRLGVDDRVQVGADTGQHQRRDQNQPLPLDPQALPAGRQDHQPAARPLQHPGQRRRSGQQMFTVIEHQQQLLVAQELHQRLAGGLPGRGTHREHRSDRIIQADRIADRGQLAQPRASGKSRLHLLGDLHREAGLAHPAHTGQRHHPRLAQRSHGPLQLPGPADERTHRQRQIPRKGAGGSSASRDRVGRAPACPGAE